MSENELNKELSANTTLSHYRIVSKIGAGGMGEVYLAQDTRLDRRVALKILPADLAANQDRMRRFVQEAKAAAALNHPNIATIHEIGESDGVNFIAMEYIDGQTLREKIHKSQTELRKLLRFLQNAAEGLAKAHSAGIIHRDLKPDNIMVTRDGHAKILDFGLAKLIEQQPMPGSGSSEAATAVMPQHSTPGAIMGTVGYMSPEQAQGKTNEIDQRSDIFSFGCILYEAVTGKKPFEGDSVVKSLHMVIYESAPSITELNPSAPADLQRIVRRCLAKDPDERYQSIKEVAIELKELRRELQGAGIDTTVVPPGRSETTTSPRGEGTQSFGSTTDTPSLSTRGSSAEYFVSGTTQHKLATAISLVVLVAGITAIALYLRGRNSNAAISSIAVLPFENRSGSADTDYLSDGLAESLIYRLSQLPDLRVSPTSSVFRYKGKETDPQVIAKELGVDSVMTGRITQRGDNLTISVNLVDTRNGKSLWGEQYERKISELLNTQREIASEITNKLQLKLSGVGEQKLTKKYTDNNEAYQLYLKGRYYWNKRTEENLDKAIQQFKAAADKDPSYALAYAGLADCYSLLPFWKSVPSDEVLPQAKAYATRAIAIDDSIGEAHISLAFADHLLWNWAAAEREYKRGLELNPNYATGHKWYGQYLMIQGRFDEALTEIKRAQELEPVSLVISYNLAERYLAKGDTDAAAQQCKRAIELDPDWFLAYRVLALSYVKQGRNEEALAEAEKAVELSKRQSDTLGVLGYVLAQTGKRSEALQIGEELKAKFAKQQAKGIAIARVYLGLNDKDEVFSWLVKDLENRNSSIPEELVLYPLNELRDEARSKDLRKRMGLPE